jgi:hypothetical protein
MALIFNTGLFNKRENIKLKRIYQLNHNKIRKVKYSIYFTFNKEKKLQKKLGEMLKWL